MPVITPTITQRNTSGLGHVLTVTWAAIGDADTCAPVQMGAYADRSVQVFGTFGGATIAIVGSNEDTNDPALATNYVALHDPQGVALTMTAAKIEEIAEITNWTKPTTASGTASSLTVAMTFRGVL